MAKLALIYGMRLLPVDDLGEVQEATVVLKNGRTARIAMHLIEGTKEEIEATFRQSINAFLRCIRRFRLGWHGLLTDISYQISVTRRREGATSDRRSATGKRLVEIQGILVSDR